MIYNSLGFLRLRHFQEPQGAHLPTAEDLLALRRGFGYHTVRFEAERRVPNAKRRSIRKERNKMRKTNKEAWYVEAD